MISFARYSAGYGSGVRAVEAALKDIMTYMPQYHISLSSPKRGFFMIERKSRRIPGDKPVVIWVSGNDIRIVTDERSRRILPEGPLWDQIEKDFVINESFDDGHRKRVSYMAEDIFDFQSGKIRPAVLFGLRKIIHFANGILKEHNKGYPVMNRNTALLIDLDGTLFETGQPLSPVTISDELKQDLMRAYHHSGGAIAIVTGREMEFVDRLFDGFKFPVAAEHGAHIRLSGDKEPFSLAQDNNLAGLKAHLESLCLEKGFVFEGHKPHTVSIHVAGINTEESRQIASEVTGLFPEFDFTIGNRVIEFVPKGINKGKAVAMLMDTPAFLGKSPTYLGDSSSDTVVAQAVYQHYGQLVNIGRTGMERPDHYLWGPVSDNAWVPDSWHTHDVIRRFNQYFETGIPLLGKLVRLGGLEPPRPKVNGF